MFYQHTPTGFIWEIPGKTVDEAVENLIGAFAGLDFGKLNEKGASKDEMALLKRIQAVFDELPIYAVEEHPGADIIDIRDHIEPHEYKMPEITVMNEEDTARPDRAKSLKELAIECQSYSDHGKLLNSVVETARKALWKLDIEFNRVGKGKVDHLEGWSEANQLRYAIEDLDKFEPGE